MKLLLLITAISIGLILISPQVFAQDKKTKPLPVLELDWEAEEKASLYELEVTLQGQKQKPAYYTTEKTFFKKNLPPGKYHLRIRSLTDKGPPSPWSPEVVIDVRPLDVSLLTPRNGDQLIATSLEEKKVTFSWKAQPFAKEYLLNIWSEKNKKVRQIRTKRTRQTLRLKIKNKFFWQIHAINKKGIIYESDYAPFTFSILGQQLAPPEIDKSETHPKTHIFWKPVKNAESYQLELERRDILSEKWLSHPLKNNTLTSVDWLPTEPLPPGEYRMTLSAQASDHVPSKKMKHLFLIKPSLEELTKLR